MPFAGNGLRDAFEAQGELGFMYWTYVTNDRLAEVLAPEYFRSVCTRMRVGDMILVGVQPRPPGSCWNNIAGETRRVLLMVAAADPRGSVRVRLVQDYGRPDDPDVPLADAPAAPRLPRLPPRREQTPPRAPAPQPA